MAKKEYIERGALIEKMFPIGMPNDGAYPINAKAVRVAIEQAPTADVVEVVRCKDCKFYDRDQCYHERHIHHAQSIYQNDNDFCSYGERKVQV